MSSQSASENQLWASVLGAENLMAVLGPKGHKHCPPYSSPSFSLGIVCLCLWIQN